MTLVTDPDLAKHGIVHHCPVTGVYVREESNGTWAVFRPTSSYTHAVSHTAFRELPMAVAYCDYVAGRLRTSV